MIVHFPSPAALRAELELAVTDKDLDPAERDAALSMCLISGGGDSDDSPLLALRAIYHDHNYTELPSPPPVPGPFSHGLSLAEVAAAAELILGQADEDEEEETHYKKRQRRKRKKGSVDGERWILVNRSNCQSNLYGVTRSLLFQGACNRK